MPFKFYSFIPGEDNELNYARPGSPPAFFSLPSPVSPHMCGNCIPSITAGAATITAATVATPLEDMDSQSFDAIHSRSRGRVMQRVEIKVKMDCEGCEKRVISAVNSIRGVRTVEMNRKQSKVIVIGYVDPHKVLKKVKSTGKTAEFWPYIPQHLLHYPHSSQAYDNKGPSGYVRNVVQAFPTTNTNAPDQGGEDDLSL